MNKVIIEVDGGTLFTFILKDKDLRMLADDISHFIAKRELYENYAEALNMKVFLGMVKIERKLE